MTQDYEGTLGNKKIGMTFGMAAPPSLQDKEVRGFYFYNDFMHNIYLENGSAEGDSFLLYELNDKGQRNGVFKLHYSKTDPKGHFHGKLNEEIMLGTWSHLDGTGSLPVYLSETGGVGAEGMKRYVVAGVDNDAVFEAKVQKWRKAVLSGDRKMVASMINYPITTQANGKRTILRNQSQLLTKYDSIFTKSYIDKIRDTVPHNMFVNWQGVMLGNGQVWFDANGNVSALNND